MFEEEIFPVQFEETILHMIFKGKGQRELLSNNRFIHCKACFARIVEGLVVADGLKGPLLSGSLPSKNCQNFSNTDGGIGQF